MRFAIVLGLVIAAMWPSAAAAQSGPRNCTRTTQNLFVRDVLDEYYLWYRELPRLNPSNYASPEAYLEAARYRPLDATFSYITSRAENDAFYSASEFIGFGFSSATLGTELVIQQVFPDSPAADAGIGRGDRIVAINGRTVASLVESGQIGSAFGASQPGVSATVALVGRSGDRREVSMIKRVVTIPTVSLTRTFQVDGRGVGYLLFRNFVGPSYAALDAAFAALRDARATELVIDLRYNGGGLVDVAVHLASLIGGTLTNGRVFAEFRHNDRRLALNSTLRFESPANALNLSRVFVITTRSSASASELLINSLAPHLPVVVVGDTTYGKPVGQYSFNFCNKVLAPVSFSLVNADGRGDYFGGIPATCAAADDVSRDLGAADEASLAEAFHFIRTGGCSAAAAAARLRPMPQPRALPAATGWQAVVNAH